MKVLIQKQEVIPNEQDGGNENSENTDSNGTTLDWETTTAGCVNSVFGGADAEAAAALRFDWW